MLIIHQVFHISTHHISSMFTTGLRLALWFFVAPSFFGLCATYVFCHTISLPICSSRLLFFYGFWGLACAWRHVFLRRAIVFLILGALSRVCRLFALFSPCWLLINIFPSILPRCRGAVPMFFNCFFNVSCETLLFSLWFIAFSLFVFYGIQGDILWFLLPCFSDSCVLTHGFMRLARRLSTVGICWGSMSWHNFSCYPISRFYVLPLIF